MGLVARVKGKLIKPKESKGLTDKVARIAFNMLINRVIRRILRKRKQQKVRENAEKKIAKLKKKGRSVPQELLEKAGREKRLSAGLHRKKKDRRDQTGKRSKKLLVLLAVALLIAILSRLPGKLKEK